MPGFFPKEVDMGSVILHHRTYVRDADRGIDVFFPCDFFPL